MVMLLKNNLIQQRRKSNDGDKAPNGYYLFSITVELDKRIELRKCGDGWRGGESQPSPWLRRAGVYVREVDGKN